MPDDRGNNTNNNSENKFPNQGNFSASQNNVGGKLGQLKDIASNSLEQTRNANDNPNQEKKLTDDPTGLVDNIQKEGIKKGAEMAANALAPGSGELAKAAMNTKLGNKIVNAATKINKKTTPLGMISDIIEKNKPKETVEEPEVDEFGEPIEPEEDTLIPKEVTDKVIPASIIASAGCLGAIILIVIVVFIMVSPILYVQFLINSAKEAVTGFFEGIGYFFRGCKNEQDCKEKEQQSFYDTITDVYEDYQKKYSITLNTDLITATLTYYNPMDTGDGENENDTLPTDAIDFKKSEKKIKDLADHMVGKGKSCVTESGAVIAQYKEEDKDKECPTSGDEKVKKEDWYYLDEDKYRNYLEDEFIRKFYFNNEKNDDVDKSIPQVVNDIYERVEFVKYITSSGNSSNSFMANNSQVIIMNCAGTIELETVSLYEYLQGVLYVEGYATARSEEFLKVQAIISKNYLFAINKASPDSIPTTLKVRSCQMNQEYCSVEKGCHDMDDGKEPGHDSWDTVASGPDARGNYFRAPLTNVETLEKIKRAIDSTLNEFIVKDGKFVMTQYRASCSGTCNSTTNILDQKVANEMINNGSTYREVLAYFYDGEIVEIEFGGTGYPLDLVYNRVTSAFGWRVHPVEKVCKNHNGTDIAAPKEANIYSIADGVVVENDLNGGLGYVVVIGHGGKDNSGNYQYYSLYAHQIRLSPYVKVGDTVKAGQKIGNVGSTGTSTGYHLHIEIYTKKGQTKIRQDAVTYFKGVELTGRVGGALYGSKAECQSCVNSKGVNNC